MAALCNEGICKNTLEINRLAHFFCMVNVFYMLSLFYFSSRLSSKNTSTGKGIDGRAEDLEA